MGGIHKTKATLRHNFIQQEMIYAPEKIITTELPLGHRRKYNVIKKADWYQSSASRLILSSPPLKKGDLGGFAFDCR